VQLSLNEKKNPYFLKFLFISTSGHKALNI